MFAIPPPFDGLGLTEDCELGPDVIIGALAGAEPGAQLHGWLAMLDPTRLSEAQVMAVGAAWERQRRHDAAIELALLNRLSSLPVVVPEKVDPDGDRHSGSMGPIQWAAVAVGHRIDAYAALTAQSPVTVSGKAAAAVLVCPSGPLAATGAALAAGVVSQIRADVIADLLGPLSPADAAAIEGAVLPGADGLSKGRLQRELRTRIAALDLTTEQEQHVEARARRCVSRPQSLPAGMAFLEVLGPAEDVHLLHSALTAVASITTSAARDAARGTGAEIEGIDAHRFDALINLAAGALADGDLPTRHGKRPAIAITMALSTLLGLDDHPADLAGYGPITAEAARRAASDPTGTLQRLITRPDGLIIDAAYTSYRPPQALCDTIIARDRTCTWPRCDRPATEGDLDHEIAWPDGTTTWFNLGARCRRHHNIKTAGLATPEFDPSTGDTLWTYPWGQTVRRTAYLDPPPPEPEPRGSADPHAASIPHTALLPHTAPLPTTAWPRALRGVADALPADLPSTPAPAAVPIDDDPPPF